MTEALDLQIQKIQDSEIQSFVRQALDNTPREFWTAQSSPSGKHHPPEDQGEGGIVRHVIKCVYISDELSSFFSLSDTKRDVVVASSILHDIKKNGEPWGEKTDHCHGRIAYEWLDRFELRQPEKDEIRDCIRYHMAKWVKPDGELERALNPTTAELVVQLSDYFSSRECASFLPGVNVGKEDIENYCRELVRGV